MPDVTGTLADFVARIDYDKIPEACIRKAGHSLLDLIGVTLAGSTHPISEALLALVGMEACAPRATLIGRSERTSPLLAAFVNGATGHVLEYDDIKTRIGHPSVALVPAVLALAEERGASGKEILTAFLTGFEVSSRIAAGVEPELSMNGWHTTSAVGIFGAAAASAKLLGLDADRIRSCFGIAASFSCGLVRNFGTAIKPIHAGEAAEKGLKAAVLAGIGIGADKNVLSGKWGFGSIFAGHCNEERMIENLGDPFEVLSNGFKFYPCCASSHTAIDAVLELLKERPIDPEAVEKIEIGTVPINIDNLKYPMPKDPIEARFSMPFCVATALLRNRVVLEDFSSEWIADPRMQRLMPKIGMFLHPDLSHLGYVGTENAIVTIRLREGEAYEKRVDIPRGHPLNPLTEKELVWKYGQCAARAIREKAASRSAEIILNMEKAASPRELMALLRPFRRPSKD